MIEQYGTPLYVVSKKTIVNACEKFAKPLKKYYQNSEVLYATKANLTVGIAQLMNQHGMSIDVSSGGELYTAIKANIDPKKIYFHGNNKTLPELELAINYGVTIIIDNLQELKNIIKLSKQRVVEVMIRLKPEIEAHTHEYIKTGQLDSKFGIVKENIEEFIQLIKANQVIHFKGIHSHIGSQIFDIKPYFELIDILIPFIKKLNIEHKIDVSVLNCGGGMGINYTKSDQAFDVECFVKDFVGYIEEKCKQQGIKLQVIS